MGPCVLTRGHLNQHGSGSLEACGEHCCKHIDHHAPPSSLVLGPGSRCPGFFVDVGCPGCSCVCVPRCSQERASSRLVLRRHLVLYHCHGLHFRPFLPFLTIFQWPIPRLTHLPLDTRGSCPCTQPTTGRLNRQVLARAVCMSSLEKRSPNLHKARGSRLKAPSPSVQPDCITLRCEFLTWQRPVLGSCPTRSACPQTLAWTTHPRTPTQHQQITSLPASREPTAIDHKPAARCLSVCAPWPARTWAQPKHYTTPPSSLAAHHQIIPQFV